MNQFAGFDRYVIGERNEGMRREVQTLRLEKRLRESSGRPPGAFESDSRRLLLRRRDLAG